MQHFHSDTSTQVLSVTSIWHLDKKASVLPIPVLNLGLEEQDTLVNMISQRPQTFASSKCVKALPHVRTDYKNLYYDPYKRTLYADPHFLYLKYTK